MPRPGPTLRSIVLIAVASLAGAGCQPDVERAELTLLGTTDVHGYLVPWHYAEARAADSSLVQLAAIVDSIRSADSNVLLIDSGDFLQGSELTDYVAATGIDSVHPVIAAMNALDYDAAAIGNHEYNHGVDFLKRALADGRFPFLSANTYHAGTDSLVFPPYTIVERDGIRVAVLGLTTPGVAVWDRDHVEGRYEFRDMIADARRWLAEIQTRDPDVVVLAAHTGIEPGAIYAAEDRRGLQEAVAAQLVREVEGIDVVFAGHTAGPEAPRDIAGSLVTHAGHWGETLAVVHVSLERRAGSGWAVTEKSGLLLDADGAAPDPDILAVVRPYHEATRAWLEEELAYTPDHWSTAHARIQDTPSADLITAAMREASGADIASTAIFDPSVSFGPGGITRRDVLALYRYPNRLAVVKITGERLRSYLERSARYYTRFPSDDLVNDSVIAFNYDVIDGLEYEIDLRGPAGERVRDVRFRGASVGAGDTLSLAVNSYRQAGGGGFSMLSDLPNLRGDDRLVSELIAAYIARRDTLQADDVHRANWRLEPAEAVEQLRETGATLPRF